jgi:SEC-C motif-containing protein
MTNTKRQPINRKGGHRLLVVTIMLLAAILLPCSEAFAAKNKRKGGGNKNKGPQKGGFGGFGTPPPTLEEVLSKVKISRLPEDADSKPCPCGIGGKNFGNCCGPIHLETEDCKTPLQVLQSRYAAFCYRNIGHVIRTTHEDCRDYEDDKVSWAKDLDKEGMFDSFEFVGLEVDRLSDEKDTENEAFLDFKVRLRGRSAEDTPGRARSAASIEGEETVISERSRFLRDPDSGTWKYAGGDVRSTVEGLEDTTLNL